MKNFLYFSQISLSIGLVIVILIQSRSTGFARSRSAASFTRRGLEKLVFRLTFVLSALFIIISMLQLSL